LPADYCEFGPDFNKCKPWLLANFPDLYPQLKEQTGTEEQLDKLKIGDNNNNKNTTEDKKEGKSPHAREIHPPSRTDRTVEVKILPGGKVKKIVKEVPSVTVSRSQRNKKKWVTSVTGLSGFGIKLSDASKLFAKKFSSGASVSKEKPDEVDVQGDVQDEMIDFLLHQWKDKISEEHIFVLEDNKKVPIK
jgi:density-regulated protein DRP1